MSANSWPSYPIFPRRPRKPDQCQHHRFNARNLPCPDTGRLEEPRETKKRGMMTLRIFESTYATRLSDVKRSAIILMNWPSALTEPVNSLRTRVNLQIEVQNRQLLRSMTSGVQCSHGFNKLLKGSLVATTHGGVGLIKYLLDAAIFPKRPSII